VTDPLCTIAYDTDLRRPGCAIVQRALGATVPNDDLHRMNGWLTSPTPNMRVLPVASLDQFDQLVLITNAANPR
jgi:hypothetical protein